jgi:hypothetical protein
MPEASKSTASVLRLDPQLTGNVGLHYGCYRLSLLGWNVMPTAHRGERDDRVSFWLQPRQYENESFREAWHRIGHGDNGAEHE